MLDLVPAARVGLIGIYRDQATLQPVEYYFKVPADLDERLIIVARPDARHRQLLGRRRRPLKERGANDIRFLCLLAAPEGVDRMAGAHPDVPHLHRRDRQPSTTRATSCPASATPATACTARSRQGFTRTRSVCSALHGWRAPPIEPSSILVSPRLIGPETAVGKHPVERIVAAGHVAKSPVISHLVDEALRRRRHLVERAGDVVVVEDNMRHSRTTISSSRNAQDDLVAEQVRSVRPFGS